VTIDTDKTNTSFDKQCNNRNKYRGRFAPTPSGPLHFGSLITAISSYLDAKKSNGNWYLRIDDSDKYRIKRNAISSIIKTTEAHGFEWDGDVLYQSDSSEKYLDAKYKLLNNKAIYGCMCSRSDLKQNKIGLNGPIYDSKCRNKKITGEKSYRIVTTSKIIQFEDQLQGSQRCNSKKDIGDFIVWRKDKIISYHLATVIDDNSLGINHIVRGKDLLNSTFCQIFLQNNLGLTSPHYCHIPLALDKENNKISKSVGADALDDGSPNKNLVKGLKILKMTPHKGLESESLKTIWSWAMKHWDINRLTGLKSLKN
jgi:glutamyl-Q tRNA(Asp) synthetase